jgi:2-oxoisovalerate dehydrogenase E2 component (dihydrolipoyl transacylase)
MEAMHKGERGTEVTVPHLAESLVSATIGKWLKHPGDYVQEYDVLCELMTDKVNVEMPSPLEGTILRILVQEGESADVGAPICIIQGPGSRESEAVAAADSKLKPAEGRRIEPSDHNIRYSPAVLHLANEHRIDLRQVPGTGLGGRITRKDVLAFLQKKPESVTPVMQEQPSGGKETGAAIAKAVPAAGASEKQELQPITPLRNIIASRMRQSVSEIPHAWMMIEADVSNLVALRTKLKDSFFSKEGVRLTYTPFVLKAIVNAVKDFPILNSTWASDSIVIKKEIHLCIAIGSDSAVVTPVIRHADRKTIAGLALELNDLVTRARTGALTVSDMQGGTFTFNNTGAYGSILSYPIINYPQAAILTMEAIVRRPVVLQQDSIAIRSMVNLCLSLDHRILDGMICGRFLQRVKHYLEQYDQSTIIY